MLNIRWISQYELKSNDINTNIDIFQLLNKNIKYMIKK
jgi:hypothetical protein